MIYYNIDNLIVDMDGTLISKELSKKVFEEIYSRAIIRLKEKGIVLEEYKTLNFYNFLKISKEVKEFIPFVSRRI
jgi:hydroxymethylpyrimidine pyrophosphatase-like HAD family hydrolase